MYHSLLIFKVQFILRQRNTKLYGDVYALYDFWIPKIEFGLI